MGELPEKFPEYSIMYKTLSRQIVELEKQKENSQDATAIEQKIQTYQKELDRIREMFPDNYFD